MRQMCSICGNVVKIDFRAEPEIWNEVMHISQRNSICCIDCFMRRADEKFISWERGLKLYPTSLRTHIELCGIPHQPRDRACTSDFKDWNGNDIEQGDKDSGTKCPGCGCQIHDPITGTVKIHDISKCPDFLRKSHPIIPR